METTLFQSIVTQGGVAGVAMLALWMLNRVWGDALSREASNADRLRQDRDRLADLMERNITALTEMKTLLAALVERLDR